VHGKVVKDKDMIEITDCSATKTHRGGICFHKTKRPEYTGGVSFSLSEPENKKLSFTTSHLINLIFSTTKKYHISSPRTRGTSFLPEHPTSSF
jgi:hypothetical protein